MAITEYSLSVEIATFPGEKIPKKQAVSFLQRYRRELKAN